MRATVKALALGAALGAILSIAGLFLTGCGASQVDWPTVHAKADDARDRLDSIARDVDALLPYADQLCVAVPAKCEEIAAAKKGANIALVAAAQVVRVYDATGSSALALDKAFTAVRGAVDALRAATR